MAVVDPGRGGRGHRERPLGTRRPRRSPSCCSARSAAPTAAGCAACRGTTPATSPWPPTTPGCSTPHPAGELTGRAVWTRPSRRDGPRPCSTLFGDRDGARSSPPATTPTALIVRPRGPAATAPSPRPTRWRRGRWPGSARSPATSPHRGGPAHRGDGRPGARGRPGRVRRHGGGVLAARRSAAKSWWPETGPTCWRWSGRAGCPTRCWPGASRLARRCGPTGPTGPPTSAAITRAWLPATDPATLERQLRRAQGADGASSVRTRFGRPSITEESSPAAPGRRARSGGSCPSRTSARAAPI